MSEEIIILIKIILIDLVLSADNAIVIGMTASQFNDQIRKKVLIYGTIAAVVCRIIFAGATAFLLKINGIKTFGAVLLLWVVYKLYVDIIKSPPKPQNPFYSETFNYPKIIMQHER